MAKLGDMDREAMWDAKCGAVDAPLEPPPEEPEARSEPAPNMKSSPRDLVTLEREFSRAIGRVGPDPERVRPVRVGESPVDTSPLPGLAIPRPDELRDLERGRRAVDRRLDLHGKTKAQAITLLEAELAHMREVGLRYLLVITGKGLHSRAPGATIRVAVSDYLRKRGREHVLWFEQAPRRLGGSGALVVKVRRAKG